MEEAAALPVTFLQRLLFGRARAALRRIAVSSHSFRRVCVLDIRNLLNLARLNCRISKPMLTLERVTI
jgi:hypothetical protein